MGPAIQDTLSFCGQHLIRLSSRWQMWHGGHLQPIVVLHQRQQNRGAIVYTSAVEIHETAQRAQRWTRSIPVAGRLSNLEWRELVTVKVLTQAKASCGFIAG